jgi:hypothetical protein
MHAASSDTRSRYYALMQLASNWPVDITTARSVFEGARLLEDPAWPARLLAHGALTEGALLIAGHTEEARSTAGELYDLAMRFDVGKLYLALDAMALLACREQRYEAAARIVACADAAHEAHGQARRRPAAQRVRSAVNTVLDEYLGPAWRNDRPDGEQRLDEARACALALGLYA